MKRPSILYVIDDLGRGGAETLLMGILPELSSRFEVIIVTLTDKYEFGESDLAGIEKFSLNFSGKLSLLPAVGKLKKIIKEIMPELVHAHLLQSSIIARMACPRSTPLVYSLHTIMSKDAFDNSVLYRWLEKITVKPWHRVITVSQAVLDDYRTIINFRGPSYVLKNYVANNFLSVGRQPLNISAGGPIKLVAVGNIKPVKNYAYLLNAMAQLRDVPVSLEIYGSGEASAIAALQSDIDRMNIAVTLKGMADNIAALLPAYDLFVMSSTYEGFGIAPVEAMALGLPLLLSDIPVFREITEGNALFFDLRSPDAFAALVTEILEGKHGLSRMSARGMQVADERYSKTTYLERLFLIYDEMLERTASNKN